jgi:hypothetical protein
MYGSSCIVVCDPNRSVAERRTSTGETWDVRVREQTNIPPFAGTFKNRESAEGWSTAGSRLRRRFDGDIEGGEGVEPSLRHYGTAKPPHSAVH